MWFHVVDNKLESYWRVLPQTHQNIEVGDLTSEELQAEGWIEFDPEYPSTPTNDRYENQFDYYYDINTQSIKTKVETVCVIPLPEINEYKKIKSSEVDTIRDSNLIKSFTHTIGDISITIQTDEKSVTNILTLSTAATVNPNGSFVFRDLDNVNHTLTASEILNIFNSLQSFRQNIYDISWNLKNTINADTDVDELYGFDVFIEWKKLENPT
jgi:hypothetical protein